MTSLLDLAAEQGVPTPLLAVDCAVVDRNIEKLAAYGRQQGIDIRPHTKTHKSRYFARKQLAAGASGLTVAKTGEAEVMADGCDSILIAYPTADCARSRSVADLAGRTKILVALDSSMAVESLDAAARDAGTKIGVLVDMDVGFHRTGVQSAEAAVKLGEQVDQCGALRLEGFFIYPGHIHGLPQEQGDQLKDVALQVSACRELWKASGLPGEIVSGGSTPTAFQSHKIPGLTEIRPGTNIFNDMNTVLGGYCELRDCAAMIIATVISDAVPGQVVLDSGSKTLTSDRNAHRPDSGHGFLPGWPGAEITVLSEEHAQVDVRKCARPPVLGERVTVIPNHICPCVNLFDHIWMRPAGSQTMNEIPVDARGRVS